MPMTATETSTARAMREASERRLAALRKASAPLAPADRSRNGQRIPGSVFHRAYR
jgi:hypothetical protein